MIGIYLHYIFMIILAIRILEHIFLLVMKIVILLQKL